jgi:hypothetical protein
MSHILFSPEHFGRNFALSQQPMIPDNYWSEHALPIGLTQINTLPQQRLCNSQSKTQRL